MSSVVYLGGKCTESTNIQGDNAGKYDRATWPRVKLLKIISCPGVKFSKMIEFLLNFFIQNSAMPLRVKSIRVFGKQKFFGLLGNGILY